MALISSTRRVSFITCRKSASFCSLTMRKIQYGVFESSGWTYQRHHVVTGRYLLLLFRMKLCFCILVIFLTDIHWQTLICIMIQTKAAKGKKDYFSMPGSSLRLFCLHVFPHPHAACSTLLVLLNSLSEQEYFVWFFMQVFYLPVKLLSPLSSPLSSSPLKAIFKWDFCIELNLSLLYKVLFQPLPKVSKTPQAWLLQNHWVSKTWSL